MAFGFGLNHCTQHRLLDVPPWETHSIMLCHQFRKGGAPLNTQVLLALGSLIQFKADSDNFSLPYLHEVAEGGPPCSLACLLHGIRGPDFPFMGKVLMLESSIV